MLVKPHVAASTLPANRLAADTSPASQVAFRVRVSGFRGQGIGFGVSGFRAS